MVHGDPLKKIKVKYCKDGRTFSFLFSGEKNKRRKKGRKKERTVKREETTIKINQLLKLHTATPRIF